jgi:hypothetical protein
MSILAMSSGRGATPCRDVVLAPCPACAWATRRSELALNQADSSLVNFLFGDFSLVWIASGLPTNWE